ncbi:MAG: HAD-IC family P-type ATPase, partial [Clostridia bacterium]|nr:HAD-IC family P-type ATPase [Clostridia bacterium]
MTYHDLTPEETLEQLHVDRNVGLSDEEAAALLEKNGKNKLKEKKKASFLMRFLAQFKDVMILILIAAAAISFVIACTEGDPIEFFEPVLILFIVVANAILGVMQESKAEKALDALKNLSAPHARVLRNGKEQIIDSENLVVGDIIKLEAGDFVPADARLLSSFSLKSEESALTGESAPVDKNAEVTVGQNVSVGDRINCVFSGCSISCGAATAVVTATGMDTEMGKIANLLENETESDTPLQKKLAELGKYLGIIALVACAVVFVIGLITSIPP